jgi:hypothetical protein
MLLSQGVAMYSMVINKYLFIALFCSSKRNLFLLLSFSFSFVLWGWLRNPFQKGNLVAGWALLRAQERECTA